MGGMKIIHAYPPNFELIDAAFGVRGKKVFYAYGGVIYAPHSDVVQPETQAHEAVHLERQAADPDEWWRRYIADRSFRLDEEILAHRAELAFLVATESGRAARRRNLAVIAGRLASPLYGRMISLAEAKRVLTDGH